MKTIKLIFFIISVFLTPVVIFKISCAYHDDRIKLDGKKAEILSLIFVSDTEYAKGYSHIKFRQIKIGMTEKQVIIMLGPPLYKWKPYGENDPSKRNYIGFGYSQGQKGSYRLRQINFDKGIVVEIKNYFYID
ncbi:MAG: hypothetical protein K0S33_1589 [Bacteroidetes bacterium]|jgi:hypothetical protein|nr:hypothetical protein [Bacteroidota bacterium]